MFRKLAPAASLMSQDVFTMGAQKYRIVEIIITPSIVWCVGRALKNPNEYVSFGCNPTTRIQVHPRLNP